MMGEAKFGDNVIRRRWPKILLRGALATPFTPCDPTWIKWAVPSSHKASLKQTVPRGLDDGSSDGRLGEKAFEQEGGGGAGSRVIGRATLRPVGCRGPWSKSFWRRNWGKITTGPVQGLLDGSGKEIKLDSLDELASQCAGPILGRGKNELRCGGTKVSKKE